MNRGEIASSRFLIGRRVLRTFLNPVKETTPAVERAIDFTVTLRLVLGETTGLRRADARPVRARKVHNEGVVAEVGSGTWGASRQAVGHAKAVDID